MSDNIEVTTNDSTGLPMGDLEDQKNKSESVEKTDETLDASDASDDETPDNEPEEKPKKKSGGFQRRINKLNSRLSAEQEEKEYWRREYLKAKSSSKDESNPTPKKAEGKPKADDFETHEDYVEALTDWKTDQKFKAFEEKRANERAQREFQTKAQTHAERVKAFAQKHEDFSELVEEVSDIRVPAAVQELIVDSDFGPELMYELAKDRERLEQICSMSPLRAAKAIGRIEDKIESRSGKGEEKTENFNKKRAVNPPTPIRSRSEKATKKTIYDFGPNDEQGDYEAMRRKQRSSKW